MPWLLDVSPILSSGTRVTSSCCALDTHSALLTPPSEGCRERHTQHPKLWLSLEMTVPKPEGMGAQVKEKAMTWRCSHQPKVALELNATAAVQKHEEQHTWRWQTMKLESPGNSFFHHTLWRSVSAEFPTNDCRTTHPVLGQHWEWVSKGWFRLITKEKKHSALPQALRAAEPGFSYEPQTPLMRLVINKGLVRDGGADHWPLNKTTSHALGSDHKSRQSMSNFICLLSFLLFFTFHYPQQSHVTSKECGLIPRECVSLQLRIGNS